jgi:hypothetical protein
MIKKNILDIDAYLLPEYKSIEDLNPNWDMGEYLNLKYDINAAIALSKLYFPDFIEKDGCIILGFRYDEETFNKWVAHYKGNSSDIERKCNSYEIMEYFSINRKLEESLDSYNKKVDELAKVLKKSWEINCQLLFPDKEMIVEVYDDYDTTRITIYSQPPQNHRSM